MSYKISPYDRVVPINTPIELTPAYIAGQAAEKDRAARIRAEEYDEITLKKAQIEVEYAQIKKIKQDIYDSGYAEAEDNHKIAMRMLINKHQLDYIAARDAGYSSGYSIGYDEGYKHAETVGRINLSEYEKSLEPVLEKEIAEAFQDGYDSAFEEDSDIIIDGVLTNEVQMSLKDKVIKTAKSDIDEVSVRLASRQLVKTVRDPLAAYLSANLSDDSPAARKRIGDFLKTDAGKAIVGLFASAGLSVLPSAMTNEFADKMITELRQEALTDISDQVVDIFAEPLRGVMSMFVTPDLSSATVNAPALEVKNVEKVVEVEAPQYMETKR